MKTKLEIKNRFTGKIIFEFETENNSIRKTVQEYITQELKNGKYRANLAGANLTDANLTRANLTRANLTRADLTGANLTGADLTRADLTDANLTRADLTGANLTRADLTDANLTRADLTGANLTGADLTRADLTDANLTRANLTRANLTHADLTHADLTRADLTDANLTDADLTHADLTRADLRGANLTGADLLQFKADLWRVLLMYKNEISGLKEAILGGKINGSKYTGTCACLKGTIANVKGCDIDLLPNITKSASEPSEQWFLQFKEGHTPSNNKALKLTYDWIEEFELFAGVDKPKKIFTIVKSFSGSTSLEIEAYTEDEALQIAKETEIDLGDINFEIVN
jgi:uncharacterized protein YjbI with pentapeptide repeats